MKTTAYIISALLFAAPVYAQHNHHEDNPKYNSTKEDLTYEGWQTRQRAKDNEERKELRQNREDERQRHEDFDRLFPKDDKND